MIAFAAPAFLWAALAAGVPVAVHLLRRPAGAAVPVPGVRFFEASRPRESGAERLRRYALLAARTLAVLLLALLFARPVWLGADTRASLAAGGTGSTDAVGRVVLLLVDTSGSTAQRDARGVRGADAIADAADRELARLRPGVDAAAVLLVGVGVEPVLPEFTTNLAALRERAAERLAAENAIAGVTDWRGAFARGAQLVERAAATLGGVDADRVRVRVLTDAQAEDWRPLAVEVAGVEAVGDVEAGPTLGAALPNARLAVAEVVPPVGAQPAELRLRLGAAPGDTTGAPPVLGLAVTAGPDGQAEPLGQVTGGTDRAGEAWEAQPTVLFEGGTEPRAVRLTLASGGNDGLAGDDAAEVRIPAVRRVPVAVWSAADPRPALRTAADATGAAFLWRALKPEEERSRFDLSWTPEATATAGGVLVIAEDAGTPAERSSVAERTAAAGGAVVAFPAPDGPGWEAFDEGRTPPGLVASSAPTPLAAAVLAGLDEGGGEALGGVRWAGRADLTDAAGAGGDAEVLLRWSDGRPAAVWRPAGARSDGESPAASPPGGGGGGGGVLSFGFGVSPGSSSLPQRGVFVGLVRGAVDALGLRVSASAAEEEVDAPATAAADHGDLRRLPLAEVTATAAGLWQQNAVAGGGSGTRGPLASAARASAAARAGLGSPLFGWAAALVAALVLVEIVLQRKAAARG